MTAIKLFFCLMIALIGILQSTAFAQSPALRHGWVIGFNLEPDGRSVLEDLVRGGPAVEGT